MLQQKNDLYIEMFEESLRILKNPQNLQHHGVYGDLVNTANTRHERHKGER